MGKLRVMITVTLVMRHEELQVPGELRLVQVPETCIMSKTRTNMLLALDLSHLLESFCWEGAVTQASIRTIPVTLIA